MSKFPADLQHEVVPVPLIDGIAKLRWAVCQECANAQDGNAQFLSGSNKDMLDVYMSNSLAAVSVE